MVGELDEVTKGEVCWLLRRWQKRLGYGDLLLNLYLPVLNFCDKLDLAHVALESPFV